MSKPYIKKITGFTLVELLVATLVFLLFSTSLFALYRMGSRMYLAGSWRLQKQKESERFLNLLKERIEQSSNPLDIGVGGLMTEGTSQFGVATGTYTFRTVGGANVLTSTTRLMMFAMCKPAMQTQKGLIMYNVLRATKQVPNVSNLMNLQFLSTNDVDTATGAAYIAGSTFIFFTQPPSDIVRFDALPTAYGLPITAASITDVASITISLPPVLGLSDAGRLLKLDIEFEHPKFDATRVIHSITARVGISVIEGGL